MWRSDRALAGPQRATVADIDALNRVFSEAFTERYRRDGLSGVRVPYLNPAIWQFAIADAGEGAMLWRDSRGEVAAFNMVHQSGSQGWMGPLAVRTDRQGHGLGHRIVQEGIAWLESRGVRTIGLETMPRTIDNIGFYSRLGFVPGRLTVTLQRERPRHSTAPTSIGVLAEAARAAIVDECRTLSGQVTGGVDFSREIELTLEHGLGDVILERGAGDGAVTGFALWHSVPLAQGRGREELRILKLVARDADVARHLIQGAEHVGAELSLGRVAIRFQTQHEALYSALVADGYRVQWTDLRMTLSGKPEPDARGVLLSNWEI